MTKKPILKPGTEAPKSGQYEQVGPRGGPTGKEVTMPKGHTLPPTDEPGQGYQPVFRQLLQPSVEATPSPGGRQRSSRVSQVRDLLRRIFFWRAESRRLPP